MKQIVTYILNERKKYKENESEGNVLSTMMGLSEEVTSKNLTSLAIIHEGEESQDVNMEESYGTQEERSTQLNK